MGDTTVIIQARTGSSRLRDKVLFELEGKTVLERVIQRAKAADVGQVIVATTQCMVDLRILKLCNAPGVEVECFMGHEDDVLARFHYCIKRWGGDHIVRITADCPLIDPKIIKDTVDWYFTHDVDYCASRMDPNAYPDGMDVEIFTREALEKAFREAVTSEDREHVTPYIKRDESLAKENAPAFQGKFPPKLKLSIDTDKEYELAKKIYKKLHPKNPLFGLEDIMKIIKWRAD